MFYFHLFSTFLFPRSLIKPSVVDKIRFYREIKNILLEFDYWTMRPCSF